PHGSPRAVSCPSRRSVGSKSYERRAERGTIRAALAVPAQFRYHAALTKKPKQATSRVIV
ncbi:MAG TPA: hypothetical protein VIV60_20155, partial [Polyangiaceae bacterium]